MNLFTAVLDDFVVSGSSLHEFKTSKDDKLQHMLCKMTNLLLFKNNFGRTINKVQRYGNVALNNTFCHTL